MSTQVVADRYADAIFQAAQDLDRRQGGNATEQIDQNLADIVELLRDHADLAKLWKHPVIEVADKQAMAKQLFGGKVHPFTLNLLLLLAEKKRAGMVEGVQRAYRERYNQVRKRATVKVTSAMALDAQQVESLRHEFAVKLAKDVQVETAVDSALIGGIVVQIEDQVIDGSLRGRLEALRMSLN